MNAFSQERLRAAAVLLVVFSALACSALPPGLRLPTAAPPTASPTLLADTPTAGRTPVVFLTNTVVPRITATAASFIEDTFGLPREETLIQIAAPPTANGLDPALTTGSAGDYVGHLFSGLVRLGPDLQVEADLAESWQISPDGLVYTFTLREGLAFSTGKPLTAADVAFSWDRAADPATASPTALTYLGDIAGLRERAAGAAETISGLAAPDDRTLVVTLAQPRAQFLARLTYPVAFVVERENVATGPRWVIQPSASGPFRVRALLPEQAFIFERNPGYHTPAGVAYAAYLFAPLNLGSQLYEAGEIDIGFLDGQTAGRVRDPLDPLSADWAVTDSLCTIMLRLDLNHAPLDDPQVRQALSLALDRAGLRDRLAGPQAVLAETVLPPGLPGHNADLPRLGFDPAQAQAALAASTYAGAMPPIVLADPGSAAQPSAIGAAVAQMWRDNLGLTVNIESLTSSFRPNPGESHGHAIVYSWCADYPDPESFLEVLFHSGSDFNISAYANPQVDGWLDEARAHPDPAYRLSLYRQVEAQVLAEGAVLPWLHPTYERLIKPYVKGYVLAPLGLPIIHRVTLEWPAP